MHSLPLPHHWVVGTLTGVALWGCSGGAKGGLDPVTLTGVEVSPTAVVLQPGASQQFNATARYSDGQAGPMAGAFTATGGTINTTGLYTAGATAGSYRVIVSTEDGQLADTANITISTATLTGVVLTPAAVSLAAGASQQFNVVGQYSDGSSGAVSVTYSATGGTVTTGGRYTAGGTAGTFRVIATAQSAALADTSSVTITGGGGGTITILQEDFESNPNLDALFQDRGEAQNQRVITDATLARSGTRLLEVTYPAGGSGGWMSHFFLPGHQTWGRISAWVQLEPGWQGVTRLFTLNGSHISDPYSSAGVGGVCPEAGKPPANLPFYTAVLEMSSIGSDNGALRFYSQFLGMPLAPNNCWSIQGTGGGQGTASYTPNIFRLTPGTWQFIEFEVVLNTPGQANGSQRYWVDGVLRGEWTGIRWRDTQDVRLNVAQLSVFTSGGAPRTQRLYLDDLTVTVGQ